MDAHLFRRVCDALIPTLLGARVEKIHQPGPGVSVFAIYRSISGNRDVEATAASPEFSASESLARKRYLVLRADRKSPLLFAAAHRMAVNAHPPSAIMRLRKYLGDHRITSASCHWTERRLYLEVAADEDPVWLCLDLRDGPSLIFEPPAPFVEPVWPAPALSPLALCEGDGWRLWPVITPALRRTLPYLAPEDGQALLMDLQAGGGDVFLYENSEGSREASAWPLPGAQLLRMGKEWRDGIQETVWEDPLAALALTGESQVYAAVAAEARQTAAKPYSAEAKRLSRLLDKLNREEQRLLAMRAKQGDALLLQSALYQFGSEEKRSSVVLCLPETGDSAEETRELALNPRLTVRENMAALFHQASRGKRGLEHLMQRREAVQAEKDAAVAAMLRSEAALNGTGPSNAVHQGQRPAALPTNGPHPRGMAPSGLPRQVQAFRSSDGFLLLRGRDTRGNALILKLAAPHDYWLHTANGPSAHVIIRRDHAGQDVPERTLREAGALAALKSWLRDEERAEIQYSLAKYIHPMKKAAPGMVRIDKSEGTFWTSLDIELEVRLLPGRD